MQSSRCRPSGTLSPDFKMTSWSHRKLCEHLRWVLPGSINTEHDGSVILVSHSRPHATYCIVNALQAAGCHKSWQLMDCCIRVWQGCNMQQVMSLTHSSGHACGQHPIIYVCTSLPGHEPTLGNCTSIETYSQTCLMARTLMLSVSAAVQPPKITFLSDAQSH